MKRNFGAFAVLDNFNGQRKTPVSAANVAMQANRPQNAHYISGGDIHFANRFITQREMNSIRHNIDVAQSRAKRTDGKTYKGRISRCGCSAEGCFIVT